MFGKVLEDNKSGRTIATKCFFYILFYFIFFNSFLFYFILFYFILFYFIDTQIAAELRINFSFYLINKFPFSEKKQPADGAHPPRKQREYVWQSFGG
jgi:hypothetical protein